MGGGVRAGKKGTGVYREGGGREGEKERKRERDDDDDVMTLYLQVTDSGISILLYA